MEELTISPNPEWANEFKKIIIENYNLSLLDAACITGRAEKIVKRLKKEWLDKACKWLEKQEGALVLLKKETIKEFCKELEK